MSSNPYSCVNFSNVELSLRRHYSRFQIGVSQMTSVVVVVVHVNDSWRKGGCWVGRGGENNFCFKKPLVDSHITKRNSSTGKICYDTIYLGQGGILCIVIHYFHTRKTWFG